MHINKTYYSDITDSYIGETLLADITTDVLIIGGGITGLSAACKLAKEGIRVTLIEAEEIGARTLGRSAGIITSIPEAAISSMTLEQQKLIFTLSALGVQNLIEFIEDNELNCDLKKFEGSLFLGCMKSQTKYLQSEIKCRNELGMSGQLLLRQAELSGFYKNSHFESALFDPYSHSINPLALANEMARYLNRQGVEIFTNTKAASISVEDKHVITELGCKISFDKAIIAQGIASYNYDLLSSIKKSLVPVVSHIIVTEPLDSNQLNSIFPNGLTPHLWDCKRFFNYTRITKDKRILFGGAEVILTSKQAENRNEVFQFKQHELNRQFTTYYPEIRVGTNYFWGGIIPLSLDRLPFLGEVEKDIFTAAYIPGINFGFSCGGLTAELVLGSRVLDEETNKILNWNRKLTFSAKVTQKLTNQKALNFITNKIVEYSDRMKIRA